jgi:hypothetical protein
MYKMFMRQGVITPASPVGAASAFWRTTRLSKLLARLGQSTSPEVSPAGHRDYVNYGSRQVFCQPYEARNVALYGFVFEVPEDRRGRLQTLLDTVLNSRGDGEFDYRSLVPFVLLTFTDTGSMASAREPDSDRGVFRYREAALWMLTAGMERRSRGWAVARLAGFIPYVFVDSSHAMAAGREVYGYPKEFAWLNIQEPDLFGVEAVALDRFSPATLGRKCRLLEVRRAAETEPGLDGAWGALPDACRQIGRLLGLAEALRIPDLKLLVNLADYLSDGEIPQVFLKQFRDAADGERACYQAIIETKGRVTGFHGGGLLKGAYELRLQNFDSHPIAGELGLAENQRAVVSFRVNFDFVTQPGRELWRAP